MSSPGRSEDDAGPGAGSRARLQPGTHVVAELGAVAEAIRSNDRFLLVTHENPDGDALGSILGMQRGLEQLGKDSVMFLAGTMALPQEYSFMELDSLLRSLPPDAQDRVLVAP